MKRPTKTTSITADTPDFIKILISAFCVDEVQRKSKNIYKISYRIYIMKIIHNNNKKTKQNKTKTLNMWLCKIVFFYNQIKI